VIAECHRLGLEVWGHAGVWCYGGEVSPEFTAVDLWGRPLVPGSLPWGTMFCPSKTDLNAWIARSLADAAARYDLDGWFMDHARYPSPGHAASLFACGCMDCAAAAAERGLDLDAVRAEFDGLFGDLRGAGPDALVALATSGPVGLAGWLADRPGVLAWFTVRARILADRLSDLHAAIQAASPRPVEFGSDVFPPSVAWLGGHIYSFWHAAGATYLTGGFGPKIGWGSVARVTADSLGAMAEGPLPDVSAAFGRGLVAALVGGGSASDLDAYLLELRRIAAMRDGLPVYPPVAGPPEPETLSVMLRGIVDAGLDGAMLAGLDSLSPEQERVIRHDLSTKLL